MTTLNFNKKELFVVLAGGYGKRIRSISAKVLLPLWGKSSLERITLSAEKGLQTKNQIIIIGYQANKIKMALGEKKNRIFALQQKQLGTGHAIKIALKHIPKNYLKATLYTFPGDAGLISPPILKNFKRSFKQSKANMMILTGCYAGDNRQNDYGRIVRIPEKEQVEKKYHGQVLSIVQKQDIEAMASEQEMIFKYAQYTFSFTKKELINIKEFDSGIMAFSLEHLRKHLNSIKNNNVQKEIYLTDIVNIFNQKKLLVKSYPIKDTEYLLGFNDKTTLKNMNKVLKNTFYNQLKNIIDIKDEERFFIAEEIIDDLVILDSTEAPLNISIGMNTSISKGVQLTKNLSIGDNTTLNGNIILGENITIGNNVHLVTQQDQQIVIKKNTQILGDNDLNGQIEIAENSIIDKKVTLKGTKQKPTKIGKNSKILGYSYIENSLVSNNNIIFHTTLVNDQILKK